MQPLLKDILLENVNNYNIIYNPCDFFKLYNQPKSVFDNSAFDELKIFLMYEFHKHKNLGSLYDIGSSHENPKISKLLYNIPTNLSLKQFEVEIQKLGMVSTDKGISVGQLLHNGFNSRVLDLFGWFKIYSDKIKGDSASEFTHRIYLAVDNSCLHKFALLLVKLCDVFNLSYQFKINNVDEQNRYDNVVIYANEKELLTYINCIEYILFEYPEIKMNQQCLIAYPFDQNIALAPYLDTESESYSQIISNSIGHYRENAKSKAEFISNVEDYLDGILTPVAALGEEIKKELFGGSTSLDDQPPKKR